MTIKPHGGGFTSYTVADILYMADSRASLEPQPLPEVKTEAEAQALYEALARILLEHCQDLLTGKPGALDRLRDAAEERDRLLGEMNDRLYGGTAAAAMP